MRETFPLFLALILLAACSHVQTQPQGEPAPAAPVMPRAAREEPVSTLHTNALAGDKTAQYMLGEKVCCANPQSPEPDMRARNEKATSWYCMAARGGLEVAQYKLGEIYSGDLFGLPQLSDYRPAAKDAALRRPLALALMWYELAAQNRHAAALGAAIRLKNRMSETEITISRQLRQQWQAMPCLWSEVFRVQTQ